MRIAVLADIHGNVRALRAVMEDLKQIAADRVLNLGDTVSGPLEAAETADVLISLAWTTIRGNHDRWLLELTPDKMGRSDAAAFSELKNHHHAWLSTLEDTATIENIFATHLEDWPALLRSLRTVGENIRQHSGAEQAQLREVNQPVN